MPCGQWEQPVQGSWQGELALPIRVSSTEPPILEPAEFQKDVVVVRGSTVVLPCEARGSPQPFVSWVKDGEPWLSQSLEQGPGLQLEAVGAEDSGTYSCVAVSEAGETRRHFQLTVLGGSSGLMEMGKVVEGEQGASSQRLLGVDLQG